MSEQSVYKPSRPGARAIPLSFTGRHLLQAMREAVIDAVSAGDWHAHGGAVSRVRERIAQYMSDLEKKRDTFVLKNVPTSDLRQELVVRGHEVREYDPATRRVNVWGDAGAQMGQAPPWHLRDYQKRSLNEVFGRVRNPSDLVGRTVVINVVDHTQPPKLLNYIVKPKASMWETLHIQATDYRAARVLACKEYAERGYRVTDIDFDLYAQVAA